jgi:hypothetical protein
MTRKSLNEKLKDFATLAFFAVVVGRSLYEGIHGLLSDSVMILPRGSAPQYVLWKEAPVYCTYAVIVWFFLVAIGFVGLYLIGLNYYYARKARLRQRSTQR